MNSQVRNRFEIIKREEKEDLARRNAIYISVTYKEMINNPTTSQLLENLKNIFGSNPEDLRNLSFSKMSDEELKSFIVNSGALIKAYRGIV